MLRRFCVPFFCCINHKQLLAVIIIFQTGRADSFLQKTVFAEKTFYSTDKPKKTKSLSVIIGVKFGSRF